MQKIDFEWSTSKLQKQDMNRRLDWKMMIEFKYSLTSSVIYLMSWIKYTNLQHKQNIAKISYKSYLHCSTIIDMGQS